MNKNIFIGIDQSYTSTGFIAIDSSKHIIESKIISSNKEDSIFKRCLYVRDHLVEEIGNLQPTKIAIEGLAFAMRGNATRDLAGLQFAIIIKLQEELNYDLVIVPPPTLKKFATGSGRVDKQVLFNNLPKDAKDHFQNTMLLKKSNGLYDMTDAYFLASYASHSISKGL